jgi:ABC-type lipoprotein release transport system permease subunit
VQAVTPVFVNNQALLGSQTQTIYGVDMASFPQATTIPDTFFVGDTAHAALRRLATTSNGLLISKELATAYNVLNGDMVRMRIPSATGALTDVSLKVVGIFIQFPTSSQNSDLVVNSALLTTAAQTTSASFFLLKTDGAATTNDRISQTLGQRFKAAQIPARIETATRVISQDQSSLAGLNLAGLAAIDRIYAALIIALGLGVFLFGMLLERQREFGTLQALGATRNQVIRILVYEGGVLVIAGALAGSLIGGVIAWQYTSFLSSIFSVTLPIVTLPWQQLSMLLLMGVFGMLAASAAAVVRLYRAWPAEALRDAV